MKRCEDIKINCIVKYYFTFYFSLIFVNTEQLQMVEEKFKDQLNDQKFKYEEEVFALKQENFVLVAKVSKCLYRMWKQTL